MKNFPVNSSGEAVLSGVASREDGNVNTIAALFLLAPTLCSQGEISLLLYKGKIDLPSALHWVGYDVLVSWIIHFMLVDGRMDSLKHSEGTGRSGGRNHKV